VAAVERWVRRTDYPQTAPLRAPQHHPNSKPASADGVHKWNKDPEPFVSTKVADEILAARYR
jgi:hypothetical protein